MKQHNNWVSVWGNAVSVAENRPERYAKNITIRYPVLIPFTGPGVRLTFDNYCGTEPGTLLNGHLAILQVIAQANINVNDLLDDIILGHIVLLMPARNGRGPVPRFFLPVRGRSSLSDVLPHTEDPPIPSWLPPSRNVYPVSHLPQVDKSG